MYIWTAMITYVFKSIVSSLSMGILQTHKATLSVGLIAQLIEHCTGIAEDMASNPVQVWISAWPYWVVCITGTINHVFISFSTVQIYDLSCNQLYDRRLLCFYISSTECWRSLSFRLVLPNAPSTLRWRRLKTVFHSENASMFSVRTTREMWKWNNHRREFVFDEDYDSVFATN